MDRRQMMAAGMAAALTTTAARAAADIRMDFKRYGLRNGAPALESIGPIAFGPPGVLFVADPVGAKIFALGVGGGRASTRKTVAVEGLETRLAAYLGAPREEIFVRDMAVQPGSNTVFLSVMRGSGAAATPVLVRVAATGALSRVSLDDIPFAQVDVEKAPDLADARMDGRVVSDSREGAPMTLKDGLTIRVARTPLRSVTVTDLAYVDGTLLVAGASNEEFSSAFRRIAFPFDGAERLNSLEIFHVSHGRYETASPITAFLPYGAAGGVLAAYTCTPLVQFSLGDAGEEAKVQGKSVADLGFASTPTDMVAYRHGGEDYILVANSRRGLMKIARADIDRQDALTQKADRAGAPRQDLPQQGVVWMANLGDTHVLMLQRDPANALSLRSYAVETL